MNLMRLDIGYEVAVVQSHETQVAVVQGHEIYPQSGLWVLDLLAGGLLWMLGG